MNSYFGAPDKLITSNFEENLHGFQRIYIMQANYPGRFGALGHATLFDGSSCVDDCYFGAIGGIIK